jgi:dUTP pyrophosphatase
MGKVNYYKDVSVGRSEANKYCETHNLYHAHSTCPLCLNEVEVVVSPLYDSQYVQAPFYATDGSACFDLIAAIRVDWEIIPMASIMVPTGLAMEIPAGYFGDIRPRSGMACKKLMIVPNSPGTIDSDYREQIYVTLFNLSKNIYTVHPEDRIAQMMIRPYQRAKFVLRNTLGKTGRTGGHGHTGE